MSEDAKPVLHEDMPPTSGRDLLLRSLRKVLIRHGYVGDELEQKIAELLQKDFPRLTAAITGKQQ